jgi:hypothetical protein
MIVVIQDDVFASSRTEHLTLSSVLKLGFEGRHRLQVDPPCDLQADRHVNRWLAAQSTLLREEVELSLQFGLEADVHGTPADLAITIADVATPEWSENPRLPLVFAEKLLREPLHLLLENRRNDRAFLETLAPKEWRTKFRQCLEKGYLKIEHGGGLSEMQKYVEETAGAGEAERLRLWVLFDSDAREPGRPSASSAHLATTCQSKNIPYHQLARRTIENYLPAQALQAWAHTVARQEQRDQRRRKVEAWASMSAEQRHHYNMRGGFSDDRKAGMISVFFGEWQKHSDLQDGFTAKITELFHERDFPILEAWLQRGGQQEEVLSILTAIFRRL